MLPIHTILHPTDFSERSQAALKLACALARDHDSELVLLTVVPYPVIVYGEGVVPDDPERRRGDMEDRLNRLPVPNFQGRLTRMIKDGEPATEILNVAKEIHADLIIVGTHGRTGLARLLMGSVAELVVRRADCPVLTVKMPFPVPVEEEQPAAHQALDI